jgi:hypothetical protein
MPLNDSNASYGNDNASVTDIVNESALYTNLTVGTSAVEVKVGGSRLTNRKCVTLVNNSSKTIYWGFSNSVTVSNGTPIEKGQMFVWSVGDSIQVWVISNTASLDTRITESA